MKPRTHIRKNKCGRFAAWPSGAEDSGAVASKVRYVGSAKHKDHLSGLGPGAHFADNYKCDYWPPESWAELTKALRLAVETRNVGSFSGSFPKRAWIKINGVLHEARQSGARSSDYHGFPLTDPIHFPIPRSRIDDVPDHKISFH